MDSVAFYIQQLSVLQGFTVDSFAKDDAGFYGIVFSNGKEKKCLWLFSDDEGNAPGSFELQNLA